MINDRRIPAMPIAYYTRARGTEVLGGFKCPRCRDIVWSFVMGDKHERCISCGQAIDYAALDDWKGGKDDRIRR